MEGNATESSSSPDSDSEPEVGLHPSMVVAAVLLSLLVCLQVCFSCVVEWRYDNFWDALRQRNAKYAKQREDGEDSSAEEKKAHGSASPPVPRRTDSWSSRDDGAGREEVVE
jgi:hypothetical protein